MRWQMGEQQLYVQRAGQLYVQRANRWSCASFCCFSGREGGEEVRSLLVVSALLGALPVADRQRGAAVKDSEVYDVQLNTKCTYS